MDNVVDDVMVKEGVDQETVDAVREVGGAYKYGWETEIEMEYAPKGLNTDIVKLISDKNEEPEWMLEWRLAAYERWLQKKEPKWAMVDYPEIDFQDQCYYARPKSMEVKPKSLDEVDPKLLETYAKLGIPLKEQMLLAVLRVLKKLQVRRAKWPLTRYLTLCLSAQRSRMNWPKQV